MVGSVVGPGRTAWDDQTVQSDAVTVEAYIAELPEGRRQSIGAVRQVVLDHLPEGFEEVMQYGMISYVVPLERYPDTYNGQRWPWPPWPSEGPHGPLPHGCCLRRRRFTGAASGEVGDHRQEARHGEELPAVQGLDDLALDVIGEAIARTSVDDFVADYERSRAMTRP